MPRKLVLAALMLMVTLAFGACSNGDTPDTQGSTLDTSSVDPTPATGQAAIDDILVQYYAPLAQFPLQEAALPEELRGLVDDLATEDFVVATVDGWPILFSEVVLRAWEELNVNANYDLALLLNTLVEEKASLSAAAALNVLPSQEEVITYQDQQVQDIVAAPEMAAVFEEAVADHAAKLGITVEDYWQVLSPYHYHIIVTTMHVAQVYQTEAEAAGRGTEEYVAEKRLEWKQQVTYEQVTALPVLQFKPDLEQLFV